MLLEHQEVFSSVAFDSGGCSLVRVNFSIFFGVFRVDWKPELTYETIFAKIQLISSNREVSAVNEDKSARWSVRQSSQ